MTDFGYVILWAFSVYAAYKVGAFVAIWPIKQMLQRLAKSQGTSLESWLDEVKDKNSETIHYPGGEQNMEIISEQGIYYAWTIDGNIFLGQGKTFDELFQVIKESKPNSSFRITKEQLEKFPEQEQAELLDSVLRTFK